MTNESILLAMTDLLREFPDVTRDKANTAYKSNVVAVDFIPKTQAGRLGRHMTRHQAAALVLGVRLWRRGIKPETAARIAADNMDKLFARPKHPPGVLIAQDGGGSEIVAKACLADFDLAMLVGQYEGQVPVIVRVDDIVSKLGAMVPRKKGGWGSGKDAYDKAMAELRAREAGSKKHVKEPA